MDAEELSDGRGGADRRTRMSAWRQRTHLTSHLTGGSAQREAKWRRTDAGRRRTRFAATTDSPMRRCAQAMMMMMMMRRCTVATTSTASLTHSARE